MTIPEGVTSISWGVFEGCSSLKSITIPSSVTSIGERALGMYWDEDSNKYMPIKGFVIYGLSGSAAEKYAKKHGIKFAAKGKSTISLKAKSTAYTGKTINIGSATVKGSKGKVTYTYYSDSACRKKVSAHKNAGTYYVKAMVAADKNYLSATSKAVKLTIKKADNPMTAKAKAGLTASAKTKTTITKANAFTVSKAQGKVTFKKTKGDAKIIVASNGTVTVKNGLKKGQTYSVIVKVNAAGGTNYKEGSETVTLKIRIE